MRTTLAGLLCCTVLLVGCSRQKNGQVGGGKKLSTCTTNAVAQYQQCEALVGTTCILTTGFLRKLEQDEKPGHTDNGPICIPDGATVVVLSTKNAASKITVALNASMCPGSANNSNPLQYAEDSVGLKNKAHIHYLSLNPNQMGYCAKHTLQEDDGAGGNDETIDPHLIIGSGS